MHSPENKRMILLQCKSFNVKNKIPPEVSLLPRHLSCLIPTSISPPKDKNGTLVFLGKSYGANSMTYPLNSD